MRDARQSNRRMARPDRGRHTWIMVAQGPPWTLACFTAVAFIKRNKGIAFKSFKFEVVRSGQCAPTSRRPPAQRHPSGGRYSYATLRYTARGGRVAFGWGSTADRPDATTAPSGPPGPAQSVRALAPREHVCPHSRGERRSSSLLLSPDCASITHRRDPASRTHSRHTSTQGRHRSSLSASPSPSRRPPLLHARLFIHAPLSHLTKLLSVGISRGVMAS